MRTTELGTPSSGGTTTTNERAGPDLDGLGQPCPHPVCTISEDGGQVVAALDDPNNPNLGSSRFELGVIAALIELAARHSTAFARAIVGGGTAWGSPTGPTELAIATEELLTGVYEHLSGPLLRHLETHPRVALRIESELAAKLPIETAHRWGEPALFEVTQLFRTATVAPPFEARPPRRFRLVMHEGAVGDLDVIALEQCLIQSVSIGAAADRADRVEPLLHVAGHDPTIPTELLTPQDRAHVVLSGCSSLPDELPEGVASVVGSLWPVDDQSNSSIMAAYHARLAIGICPVEALRQAQLLHRCLPPLAWASYVHLGQPS